MLQEKVTTRLSELGLAEPEIAKLEDLLGEIIDVKTKSAESFYLQTRSDIGATFLKIIRYSSIDIETGVKSRRKRISLMLENEKCPTDLIREKFGDKMYLVLISDRAV